MAPLDQTISVGGMTCAACVTRVEKVLAKVPGVSGADVNLMTGLATVHTREAVAPAALLAAVERAGYTAAVAKSGGEALHVPPFWPVALALAFALPITLPMLLSPFGVPMLPGWAQCILATPVQFWLGGRIAIDGVKSVRAGAPSMDALVALGTWAAFGLSFYGMLSGMTHLYFDSSALVIGLVLLGRFLEARARGQAGAALRDLAKLRPDTAIVRRDGADVEVPLAAVVVTDLVIVKPGARVPVDGVVEDGHSDLDEAALTGESLPVARGPGEKVMAGAVNLSGLLVVRAETVGEETALGRLIRLVEAAQARKPAVQQLADRISAWFVPAVMVLALATLGFWLWHGAGAEVAIVTAVSVLVIACPCALGLATPAAVMAGIGAAARQGILIRDTRALGKAGSIRTIVFDKTGTLTEGRPVLMAQQAVAGLDAEEMLRLAAALQAGSLHPLARAVLAAVQGEVQPCGDMQEFPGLGVGGTVNGRALRLGSERFLTQSNLDAGPLAGMAQALQAQGVSLSFVFETGAEPRLLGLLGFADTAKPGAAAAIAVLRGRGLRCVLLSGDNPASVETMARQLGLDEAQGGVLPSEKAARVAALRAEGPVAMVGDGINDAPALAEADLGIAMAGSADVAMESAAIVLMRGDPALVNAALDIAQRTEHTIWRGLGWAFVFNAIGLPLAASGHLNPALAGAAMAFSSLSVVLNALWLRRWKG